MSDALDRLIERLAAAPADHALDGLEADVGGGIARRRAEARIAAAMAPVAIASVGLAMALGLAAGAFVASASGLADPLSLASDLAPSSLLDG
jgi:hypothetical protein